MAMPRYNNPSLVGMGNVPQLNDTMFDRLTNHVNNMYKHEQVTQQNRNSIQAEQKALELAGGDASKAPQYLTQAYKSLIPNTNADYLPSSPDRAATMANLSAGSQNVFGNVVNENNKLKNRAATDTLQAEEALRGYNPITDIKERNQNAVAQWVKDNSDGSDKFFNSKEYQDKVALLDKPITGKQVLEAKILKGSEVGADISKLSDAYARLYGGSKSGADKSFGNQLALVKFQAAQQKEKNALLQRADDTTYNHNQDALKQEIAAVNNTNKTSVDAVTSELKEASNLLRKSQYGTPRTLTASEFQTKFMTDAEKSPHNFFAHDGRNMISPNAEKFKVAIPRITRDSKGKQIIETDEATYNMYDLYRLGYINDQDVKNAIYTGGASYKPRSDTAIAQKALSGAIRTNLERNIDAKKRVNSAQMKLNTVKKNYSDQIKNLMSKYNSGIQKGGSSRNTPIGSNTSTNVPNSTTVVDSADFNKKIWNDSKLAPLVASELNKTTDATKVNKLQGIHVIGAGMALETDPKYYHDLFKNSGMSQSTLTRLFHTSSDGDVSVNKGIDGYAIPKNDLSALYNAQTHLVGKYENRLVKRFGKVYDNMDDKSKNVALNLVYYGAILPGDNPTSPPSVKSGANKTDVSNAVRYYLSKNNPIGLGKFMKRLADVNTGNRVIREVNTRLRKQGY